MARVRITIELCQAGNKLYPHRVKVNITNKLLEIDVFLANDGFVTILEELAAPMMT